MSSPQTVEHRAVAWLRRLFPASLTIPPREQWRIIVGAGLGILLTGALSRWCAPAGAAWLIAPIGASTVLAFAIPSSPLAQPWSIVGGNTLSALAGTVCAWLVPDLGLAAALAVSLAIGAMLLARCVHPPGGAAALLVVLSNHPSWSFVAFPVLFNSVLLVLAAMAYHSATGHTYPHRSTPEREPNSTADTNRFTRADLDAALLHYNEVLDVNPDDLAALLHHAQTAAYQRTLGELRCQDVMTPAPKAVEFGTELHTAWALMRASRVKALPVLDRARRVVGIVTVADFLRLANLDDHQGLATRLQNMMRPSGRTHSDRPEVVGQIMTRHVRVVSAHRHAVELLPMFSEAGHHHLPVIDAENRLIGILTQSDLVRALGNTVQRPAGNDPSPQ